MKNIHSVPEYLDYINAPLGLRTFNSFKLTTVGINQRVIELVKMQTQ